MLKNFIKYYYNIDVIEYRKIGENYKLKSINNNIFWFIEVSDYNEQMLREIINLYIECSRAIKGFHQLIKSKNGDFKTIYNNKLYILVRYRTQNSKINYKNIIIEKKYSLLVQNNWLELWEKKIDYLENKYKNDNNNNLGKYFDYFIGLAEIAIIIQGERETDRSYELVIQHKRTATESFLDNPLNLIIDYKVRDLAEYIKHKYIYDELDYEEIAKIIKLEKFGSYEMKLLVSRILYPTIYFDLYIRSLTEKKYKLNPKIQKKLYNYDDFLSKMSRIKELSRYFARVFNK